MVALAHEEGFATVIVPEADAREASLVEGVKIIPVASLAQLVAYLQGEIPGAGARRRTAHYSRQRPAGRATDLADIKGQEHVKRALEVAAAGGHNMIMCGPPGSGKTLLARALPSILPPMTTMKPWRSPRSTASAASCPPIRRWSGSGPSARRTTPSPTPGLVGGGHFPKPGEISLSHRGVLFLDELPEFGHSLLEVLRQPLEDKVVTISRAQGRVTFPASFMLVGAMNPCPCGYYGDPFHKCTCPPGLVPATSGASAARSSTGWISSSRCRISTTRS